MDENGEDSTLFAIENKPYCSTTMPIRQQPQFKITFKQAWPQFLASCIGFTTVIQAGVYMSYSAILLPQLSEKNSDINITLEDASWIASCVALALPIASFFTGPLMDRYGRKSICILSCIPFLISYLSFAFAKSLTFIFIGRLASGIAGGLTTSALIYASESSVTELRPVLLSFNSVAIALGILITCVLSLWFAWRSVAIVLGVSTVICMIALFFVPESPHWCAVFKKDPEAVKKSLKWLYRDQMLYTREWEFFEKKMEQMNSTSTENISFRKKIRIFINDYKDPIVYKPFLLLVAIFCLQQLSGCYIVIFYAVDLFTTIGGYLGTQANEYVSLVFLGLIRFIMAIIVSVISHRIGRRTLMICSSSGMGLSTLAAIIYMLIDKTPVSGEGNPFLLICILSFVTFSGLGLLVIPWNLIGELLPVKVRGKLGGLMISVGYVFMFITLKLWPISLQTFGITGMFGFFTCICLFNAIFVWWKLPETLGRSFDEIEVYFK